MQITDLKQVPKWPGFSCLVYPALIAVIPGCARELPDSLIKGFSASSGSKNVAVLMSGSHEQHIPKNVRMIREVMSDPNGGYNFEIIERQKVTNEQAVQATMEAAKKVGPGGTLLWYFSSHGAPNGALRTFSRQLKLKQITEGIQQARGGVPLKRLVVIVQACFSGQIVNGSAAVQISGTNLVSDDRPLSTDQYMKQLFGHGEDFYFGNTSLEPAPKYGQLAEQLIVMSASAKGQYSMYSGDGSHFTKALYKTFKSYGTAHGTTMRTFLNAVQKNTRSSTPQFRAEPESVLDEPLHNPAGGTAPPSIFLKLGNTNSGSSALFAAAKTSVDSLMYCLGELTLCSDYSAFKPMIRINEPGNGMRVFGATEPLSLSHSTKLTVWADPQTVGGPKRTVTLKRKQ